MLSTHYLIVEEFSKADLQPHPNTTKVMDYFAENCIFVNEGRRGRCNVRKFLAKLGYKMLCEWSVLDFRGEPEVTIEEKDDHILWSFSSIQLRKGFFPTWIVSPKWYNIDFAAKIYFNENDKISKFEMILNDFTPLDT